MVPATVVVHLDMDALYAQVEAVRLGVSTDPVAGPPLAVQQWDGIIAVNYPARAFGVTRFMRPAQARVACPAIHMVRGDGA